MMIRKKNTRQRGSKTHGWGAMKKHRGAGNRGGRGMAGTGKRGDAKKPSIWKSRYFGKKGFNNHRPKLDSITTQIIEDNKDIWISKEVARKEDGTYVIDLSKMKIGKLVSKGTIKSKFKLTVSKASQSAVDKIKDAGGEVILPAQSE